jgi:hypothetical protein
MGVETKEEMEFRRERRNRREPRALKGNAEEYKCSPVVP